MRFTVGNRWLLAGIAALALAAPAAAQSGGDAVVVEAREALRKKDKRQLIELRRRAADHPLAMWVEYWEIGTRLAEAELPEIEAFYSRWAGTYVEDRLRNDWLLELGRRRDFANLARDYARFRMNDDREVACYALLAQHLAGNEVRDAARGAWFAQREFDDGCQLLASTLYAAKRFVAKDAWAKARLAVEANRPRVARAAVALVDPAAAGEWFEHPGRFVKQAAAREPAPHRHELVTLALMRLAAEDPEAAAAQLGSTWQRRLSAEQAALVWGAAAKSAAFKLMPEAYTFSERAWRTLGKRPSPFSDDMLAWQVRAALRSTEANRHALVLRAVEAMSPGEQRDVAWSFWKARAIKARAAAGSAGNEARGAAQALLEAIATPLNFYGKLAIEELGSQIALPGAPQPLSAEEREAARLHPGLARALHLIGIGLRHEGVREWNFSLRGMTDRELLAAAEWACEREVWDRCINTSDRTRSEVDLAQRFPMPFKADVMSKAREVGVDPATVYGVIRQESRFILDLRSSAGASGLMQLMPGTARWTARRAGVDYRPEQINDRDLNLLLGMTYLKLVLDDFGASLPLAAAAYNAGPSRPRKWREGSPIEAAAWAESIPFNETRDYVKKVLSNAAVYSALIAGNGTAAIKPRLGGAIGPRDTNAPGVNRDLP
jgi:soluble lytic murein transglycosylase